MYPSYLELYHNGELEKRITRAFQLLESCSICPRNCRVNRLKDQRGFCKTGYLPRVYNYMAHSGEEPCISGSRGSGTIFFSGCNMACVYCQNYKFSQLPPPGNDTKGPQAGDQVDFSKLAEFMLQLQSRGCHNINLVTPTHLMPQILKALSLAIAKGLSIPLVYNTGGYELPEMIKLLDGIVDIFLVDMRYADQAMALKYSSAVDYPRYNQAAVRQIYRQTGQAQFSQAGLLLKGMIGKPLFR